MPPLRENNNIVLNSREFLENNFPIVLNLVRTGRKQSTFKWRFGSRPDAYDFETATTSIKNEIEPELVESLMKSYVRRLDESPSDQWSEIFKKYHLDIHSAMAEQNVDLISEILANPGSSDLFYGFDSLSKSLRKGGRRIEDKYGPALAFDGFVRLGEAMGARRVDFPENYTYSTGKIRIDDVIDEIEEHIGFELTFPNPFPGEYGLKTKRGIASYRVPQAIYQAWKLAKIGGSVVEIGGGLGRTAYYASKFGITDYTIVDIPITSLAQGVFLGQVAGDIGLEGEENRKNQIKLISPNSFFENKASYGAVLNVDSLTELGEDLARKYLEHISKVTPILISINHEMNDSTIASIMRDISTSKKSTRNPYWMRRGYVEETFLF